MRNASNTLNTLLRTAGGASHRKVRWENLRGLGRRLRGQQILVRELA